jgi:hypothetical protein
MAIGNKSNPYKEGWKIFTKHAASLGYIHKVVGDEAFTNNKGKILRLKSISKKGILVYKEPEKVSGTIGERYFIKEEHEE